MSSRTCEEVERSKLNKEIPPCQTLPAGARRGEGQRAATRGYRYHHFHVSLHRVKARLSPHFWHCL